MVTQLTSEDLLKGMKYQKPEIKREKVMTFMFDAINKKRKGGSMVANNVHPATDAGKSRNTCIDDFYDEDILTDEECPSCGAKVISHPDCTTTCSNSNCEFFHIRIDDIMEREEYMNKSEQKRQELCKILEEVKVKVKSVLEETVRKYDAELTPGHINYFMSCLLQPISRHFGGID